MSEKTNQKQINGFSGNQIPLIRNVGSQPLRGILMEKSCVAIEIPKREDRTNFSPQGNKRLTHKCLIFRNTRKWRVKHACIASLDFVNLKTFVREYTIKKSVKIFLGAKDQKLAKKDIQRSVKNTKLTKDANLEANVPTNIQSH